MTGEFEDRLLVAAETGDNNTTRKLLKKWVNPNVKDVHRISALAKACEGTWA